MKDRVVWLGRYEGYLRWLCRGIREYDTQCIRQAAHFYSAMLPEYSVVIPMPGHNGIASQMLYVANEIKKLRKDVKVCNVLASNIHVSNYLVKKDGRIPLPIKMLVAGTIPEGPKIIIDNVVVSGVTAQAALDALPSAMVFCLCNDMFH